MLRDKMRYHFDRLGVRSGGRHEALFGDLSLSDACVSLLSGQAQGMGQQLAVLKAVEAHASAGRQVFELGAGLLDLFERTDMGKLTGEMLTLPYPAIYLHLDGGAVVMERARDSRKMPVTGIYVCDAPDLEAWLLVIVARGETVDAVISLVWAAKEWADSKQTFDEVLASRFPYNVKQDADSQVYLGALRVIAHTLLYLASKGPSLEEVEDAGRRRLAKDARRFEGSRRGEEAAEQLREAYTQAKVTRVYPQAGSVSASKQQAGQGPAPSAHWVRGHWQHRWVGGKESEERRLEPRWIQPYERGNKAEGAQDDVQDARVYKLAQGRKEVSGE